MFTFKQLDSYDKTEAKTLKQQLDAAFHLGNGGTEVNQPATDAMNKSKADVAAIARVQQMFANLPPSDKLHQRLSFQLTQENKWLAHHTKCVEATKRGYEKMKLAAKALIDEAFAAGEAEAEKKLKLKRNDLQANANEKNKGKEIDPKFQQQDSNKQTNQQQNQNDQNKNKQDQNKAAPVTIVVDNLVIAKGKKAKKYAGRNNGFVQPKKPH